MELYVPDLARKPKTRGKGVNKILKKSDFVILTR